MRVPQSVRVHFEGTRDPLVTGKDLILALLGRTGVSGATYAALEFGGPVVEATSVDERMALCNMAVEAGAKTGIVPADDVTLEWLAGRTRDRTPQPVIPDPGASYADEASSTSTGMRPLVAAAAVPRRRRTRSTRSTPCASTRSTSATAPTARSPTCASCARCSASTRCTHGTRLIVVPASQRVYLQALGEGLIERIVRAGGAVSMPTCGACFGGHTGVLDAGEVAVATTNRNFRGRMGHRESAVYLANAYVAGAAAVAGELVDPAEVLGRR